MSTCSVSVSIVAGVKRSISVLEAEMDLAFARQKRRAIEAEYALLPFDEYKPEHIVHEYRLADEEKRCEKILHDARYTFDMLEMHTMLKPAREKDMYLTPFHDGIDEYGHYTGPDAFYAFTVVRHLPGYEEYVWPEAGDFFTVYAGRFAGQRLQLLYSFVRDGEDKVTVLVAKDSTNKTRAVVRELCVPPYCFPPGVLYDAEVDVYEGDPPTSPVLSPSPGGNETDEDEFAAEGKASETTAAQ